MIAVAAGVKVPLAGTLYRSKNATQPMSYVKWTGADDLIALMQEAYNRRLTVSGALLPPCNARFEPQDANQLWLIGSHIWSTI